MIQLLIAAGFLVAVSLFIVFWLRSGFDQGGRLSGTEREAAAREAV